MLVHFFQLFWVQTLHMQRTLRADVDTDLTRYAIGRPCQVRDLAVQLKALRGTDGYAVAPGAALVGLH